MKIRLPRQEFQEALSAVHTLTTGRTTKPVFESVLLRTEGERLELCGTDGEAALRVSVVTLATEQPGQALVKADRLFQIVRELDDVEIVLESTDRGCTLQGHGSEFKLFVQNPEDFPPVPEFDGEPDLTLSGHELKRMISLTAYAAARETSRYAINGVLWDKTGKKMFMVATDGRRLARAGGSLEQAKGGDFQLIIPSKALTVLDRVFHPPKDGSDWAIEVRVMPNQVLLKSGETVLSTALVDGSFPKYEDVIPKESNKRARMPLMDFHGAIKRAALLTTEDSRAVRLSFSGDRLVISSNSPEQGEARLEMAVDYDGEPLDIGFNPAFVNEALRAIPYDEIVIELHESVRPGVICGPDKNEFLYVVMPVSLAN